MAQDDDNVAPPAPGGSIGAGASTTVEETGDQITIPQALSPSRAGDFMTCPLLFRFRSIDRIPQEPSPAAVRGTLVHLALESLFDLPPDERVPQRARELVAPSWQSMLEEEPAVAEVVGHEGLDQWMRSAQDLVQTYFVLEDPQRFEPTERETLVEAQIDGGLTIRGYIDRLDVAPTGQVRVVDYKTGRSPREAFAQKSLFQMLFYALAHWRSTGVMPAQVKLLYLGDGQVMTHVPTEDELIATERKIRAIWDAIATAIERREFEPRRSRLCDWCQHQDLCPEFGGDPPPLPLLTIVPFESTNSRSGAAEETS